MRDLVGRGAGQFDEAVVGDDVSLVVEDDEVGEEAGLGADVGQNLKQELGLADAGLAHDGDMRVGVPDCVVQLDDDVFVVQLSRADGHVERGGESPALTVADGDFASEALQEDGLVVGAFEE